MFTNFVPILKCTANSSLPPTCMNVNAVYIRSLGFGQAPVRRAMGRQAAAYFAASMFRGTPAGCQGRRRMRMNSVRPNSLRTSSRA
jgi:hypothetical protein